ncbi:monocarboxylate transporter 12-like [Mizuhopecten yessoensis]|uniref:Monocarboxylate transporter 12-B n=1 Tax=Mizuhopecten yessoensis TaxID=6573 RepID=A0A210PMZ3_MIZYE|nr:monocarboxylate transporter 12-like [Mizuhopecten yessoensis]XP_021379440.1 monocarboxylate transporter 12-like [Mizuhopecten yessoensis]OWF37862.1 Monocarboxylate transporter 12-B [Mizuhopecten yessoensis]
MAELQSSSRKKKKRSQSISSSSSSSSSDYTLDSSSSAYSMPPAPDGGWGWVIVLSSFMIMLISDGFAFSFGVLFTELLDVFQESKSYTSWIASLFYGVPLICGPISSALATKYGCRKVQVVGGLIAFIGVFASTFANSVAMLCVTLGIIAGFGLSVGYVTSIVMVAFYFEKKRALATGLAVCGSGLGTFLFAPLIEYLIEHYTWRGSFLILSGVTLNLVVCGFLLRPLKFSPQEQWKRKLEAFEKLSKTVSRSISKTSLSDYPRSRHTSHTDDVDSDSDTPDLEHMSYSQVQLPTYIQNELKHAPENLVVEVTKTGKNWQHVLRTSHQNAVTCSSSMNNVTSPSLNKTVINNSSRENGHLLNDDTGYIGEPKISLMDNGSVWKRDNQRRKRQAFQYYPLYRKDLFYRGNLMKLPHFEIRSCSCPELHLGSMDEESSDGGDICRVNNLLKIPIHMIKVFKAMFDLAVLRNPLFIVFLLSNFMLYFWYDVPYVFIVDRAKEFGISEDKSSLIISSLGIANTFGQILYGIVGDRDIHLELLYGISLAVAGTSVALVPLFIDQTVLCILAACYGIFVSANYVLSSVMLVQYLGMDKLTNAYGLTMLLQGIANLVGPPVAGKLYDDSGSYDHTFYAGGFFIAASGLALLVIPVSKYMKRIIWRCREKKPQNTCISISDGPETFTDEAEPLTEELQEEVPRTFLNLIITEIETVV